MTRSIQAPPTTAPLPRLQGPPEKPATLNEDQSPFEAPAAIADPSPEEDRRRHAEMLFRLVADHPSSGLLVVQGRDADPQTGQERFPGMQFEDSGIVNGIKHVRTQSRRIADQIVDAADELAEHVPYHHLYAPIAIMDDALPAGRTGLEADIVGALGLVAHFEGVADYNERLPLEPDYVLACGDEVQACYLLDEPALVAQAKPVAMALQQQAACHSTIADLASGSWVAGTFRYSPDGGEPVRVIKPWNGSRSRLADLQDALGITLRSEPEGWPKPLGFAAFHGLARKVVEKLLPHSEADSAALLVHFLVAFGNAVGRGPHAQVEADRHAGNLYVAFVKETGEGRKGTAAGRIRDLFARADADWAKQSVKSGMSSGEGLIQAIRDPLEKPVKEKGQEDSYKTVVYDQGVDDKRLFLREPELSRMFRAMALPGNTLSQIIRSGWDGQDLEALTKHKPLRATNPHISVAGDITVDELRRFLGRLELVNGFANRFLFVCTRRSKSLPEGGGLTEDEIDELAAQLRKALEAARKIGRVERHPEARELWAKMYVELSADRPALLGVATSRAAAQVLRLSLIYALLDGSGIVSPPHLRAAREVWRYCEDSARYVLGDALDPMAEKLLVALRNAGEDGLSGTEIRDLLGRHARIEDLNRALAQLEAAGLAIRVRGEDRGSARVPVDGAALRSQLPFISKVLRHGDQSDQSDGSPGADPRPARPGVNRLIAPRQGPTPARSPSPPRGHHVVACRRAAASPCAASAHLGEAVARWPSLQVGPFNMLLPGDGRIAINCNAVSLPRWRARQRRAAPRPCSLVLTGTQRVFLNMARAASGSGEPAPNAHAPSKNFWAGLAK